jgi:oligopeptidase A
MEATSPSSAVDNPFLHTSGLPKFAALEPSDLTPAVDALLLQLDQDFEALEAELKDATQDSTTAARLSFHDVVSELEKMQFDLSYVWGVAGHLNGVKNNDDLRNAYELNQPKIVKAMSKFSQSKVSFFLRSFQCNVRTRH